MAIYSEETKVAAKSLWLKRWSANDIQRELNLNNARVVYQWAEKGHWNDILTHETAEQAATRRLVLLIQKEDKTEKDFEEIHQLSNLLDKLAGVELKKAKLKARLEEQQEGGSQSEGSSSRKKKGKQPRNDISGITEERLTEIRQELFFDYQHTWHRHKSERTRFILRSRQIGATYYFAWEAFEDAILTGDNQIFLSASRSQAEVFKAYIIKFALEFFDITLKGADTIVLSNGAELRFVSTNSRTAQGYHGHLYIDEVFWIPDFERLNKLASAMASQKKWRKTYFSTPSVKSHTAYPLWSGEKFNEQRTEKATFDITHATLKAGVRGPDNIWRHVVTIRDAEEQGCDLFDIPQLEIEYTKSEFNNLFMCAFLEAGQSVFNLDDLLSCAVDSNVVWVDFKNKQRRPFGNRPVWIGYDPARFGDMSCLVVVAPPLKPEDKFRVLEKVKLKGSFPYQANRIKDLTEKYNVQFIGIDTTGQGLGVYEMVQAFYPRVTSIHYGLETKTALVLKAIDVVESHRIEWDAEHADIAQAFLQVKKTTTKNEQITYVADRTSKTGHADVAWSIMHALSNEPLNRKKRKTSVAFSK